MRVHLQRHGLRAHFLSFCVLFLFSEASHAKDDSSDSDSVAAQNEAGASGSSEGSSGLSKTGMAILCTIVGLVAILGVSSAILYLVAKRRQWRVRDTIRRSARRVGEVIMTPLTPKFPKSVRSPGQQSSRDKHGSSRPQARETAHRQQSYTRFDRKPNPGVARIEAKSNNNRRGPDLEKGLELQPTKTTTVEVTTTDSSSVGTDQAASRKGWGSMFSFGRK